MAVKVMVAPAIVQRDANPPQRKPRTESSEAKPKRRRASVFDGDGNEVLITLMCLKCQKVRPLSQFGLRKMPDGTIRNQPWCRSCRGSIQAGKPRRQDAEGAPATARDPSISVESPAPGVSHPESIVDAGLIAAQVVAALHGGRR